MSRAKAGSMVGAHKKRMPDGALPGVSEEAKAFLRVPEAPTGVGNVLGREIFQCGK